MFIKEKQKINLKRDKKLREDLGDEIILDFKNESSKIKIPLNDLKGKIIGIDFLNNVLTYLGISNKKAIEEQEDPLDDLSSKKVNDNLICQLCDFYKKLLSHDITPLIICDGVSQKSKDVEKRERRKAREKEREKMKEIKNILTNCNILERDPVLLEEYKKYKSRNTFVDVKEIINFLKNIGFAVICSDDEAENLGSSLVEENKIEALWTSDTDSYALGCSLVVKGFEQINGKHYINAVVPEKIRETMKFSKEEFLDWCILLGTDFNDRIRGVGPATAYKIIKRYHNLEEAEKEVPKYGFHNIDYKNIRKQLSCYKTDYKIEDFQIDRNKKIEYDEEDDLYQRPEVVQLISMIKKNN